MDASRPLPLLLQLTFQQPLRKSFQELRVPRPQKLTSGESDFGKFWQFHSEDRSDALKPTRKVRLQHLQPSYRSQSQFRLLVPRTMARVGGAKEHTAAFWPVLILALLSWIVLLAGMFSAITCSNVSLVELGWSATSAVLVTLPRYNPGWGCGLPEIVPNVLLTVVINAA